MIDPAAGRTTPTHRAITRSPQLPRKGGRRPKAKGARLERRLVDLLQRAGIGAERIPLSGSAGGKFAGDLSIPILGIDRCAECKVRGKGFGRLYAWLAQRDLLIIRQDRREPLVVIPIRPAIEIAVAAERGRQTRQEAIREIRGAWHRHENNRTSNKQRDSHRRMADPGA
jgi:hypothetical protein